MKPPRPIPPVPRDIPVEPYVAPVQVTIFDHLDVPPTLPPAAVLPVAAQTAPQVVAVEHIAAHPTTAAIEAVGDVASEIEDEIDDGLSYADHAVRAAPRDASGAFLPRPLVRPPLILQIAKIGQALYGKTWMARVAADIGEYERKMRRWVHFEGRPPADALSKLKAAAERQIARIRDAIDAVGGAPPTEVEASKASDAPHVRDGDAVAQALARHVELRKAARVERSKAARKGPRVDDA